MRQLVAEIGQSYGMFAFECGDRRIVDVRARELSASELVAAGEAPRVDPEQRYRPVLSEPVALTAEEIAAAVVRP